MSTTTSLQRSPGEVWRSVRRPVLVIGAVLGLFLAFVFFDTARTSGPFSPDSTDPAGAKALAVLLGNHNVHVTGTTTAAAATPVDGAGHTLLIAPGGSLDAGTWSAIGRAGWSHIVLFRPTSRALDELAPGVEIAGSLASGSRESGCDLPAATRAGSVTAAGTSYSAPDGAVSCYGDGIHGSVVRLTGGDRIVDVVGTPASFTNAHLAEDGNAALALNLLGTHGELTWFLPGFEAADPEADPANPLVPDWARYVAWMSAFTALAFALWRGRRLGPVVPEALPVVVHAAETTEGRARLYRRSRARDRAGWALRESALARMRGALGLGLRAEPAAVVSAVAGRTGRDPAAVHQLLYGPPPFDDAALLTLSRELDALTQEVRRP